MQVFKQSAKELMILISDHAIIAQCEIDQKLAKVPHMLVKFLVPETQEIFQDHLVNDWTDVTQLLLKLCFVQG